MEAARRYQRHRAAVPIALILWIAAPSRSQEPSSPKPSAKLYPSGTTSLYGAARGGRVIGTIPPGTELQAAGPAQGPRVPVRVSGWSLESAPSLVFAAVGMRIVQAELGLRGPSRRVLSGQQTDPYGSVWQRVSVDGWVDQSDLVPDVNQLWKQAGLIYQQRCGGCHALHPPAEFTANQWPNVLKIMAHNAALTPEQGALVTQYLQTHAKDQGSM